jgi:hypothetical protein
VLRNQFFITEGIAPRAVVLGSMRSARGIRARWQAVVTGFDPKGTAATSNMRRGNCGSRASFARIEQFGSRRRH